VVGSTPNFTVGISCLNVNTCIIARIGRDYSGEVALGELEREGVNIQRLLKTGYTTGMIFIAADP